MRKGYTRGSKHKSKQGIAYTSMSNLLHENFKRKLKNSKRLMIKTAARTCH